MQVINYCSNPPLGLEWQVRRSLRLIDQSHLKGLGFIYLEDELPIPPDMEREEDWVRRVYAEGNSAHISGWYAPGKARKSPAGIMLYVQVIYRGVPSSLWWSTVPTLCIVRTLAHEVAHHLIATGSLESEGDTDEEITANCYAAEVMRQTTKKWGYKLGLICLKEIAGWHYAFGSIDWRQENYKSAANHFLKAWHLDPNHEEAGDWYWRAKDKVAKRLTTAAT